MNGLELFHRAETLNWKPEIGIGYYPVKETPYDAEYFQKYSAYETSDIGIQLNSARLELVRRYVNASEVIDIGIGSGMFMNEANCEGFDINPVAIELLKKSGSYVNPYERKSRHATFWDSLEHITEISDIFENITGYAFVSIPIFRSCEHILQSKHFRKDEHCWYFTEKGIEWFMESHGFFLVEHSTIEIDIGREDIHTFVFRRENEN